MTESNGYRLFADGTYDFFWGFWKNIKKDGIRSDTVDFFREVNLT